VLFIPALTGREYNSRLSIYENLGLLPPDEEGWDKIKDGAEDGERAHQNGAETADFVEVFHLKRNSILFSAVDSLL
jgi:hypothetical protein